eukprot:13382592-Alexandrium_andersonii.AAC.1
MHSSLLSWQAARAVASLPAAKFPVPSRPGSLFVSGLAGGLRLADHGMGSGAQPRAPHIDFA